MSGVQNFTPKALPHTNMLTSHDWSKSGNPPPNNYFKTREANINDCVSYDDYCSYYSDCYQPEYNYENNYNNYDTDYAPGVSCDISFYQSPNDEQPTDGPNQQAGPSHSDQDFQDILHPPRQP